MKPIKIAFLTTFVANFHTARKVQLQPFLLTNLVHILCHKHIMDVLYEKPDFDRKYWAL